MVGFQSLAPALLLLGSVFATPLERRDTIVNCVQGGQISRDYADGIIHQAPGAAGRSGYPHVCSPIRGYRYLLT